MPSYYADHAQQLKRDLAREIPVDALRELHRKRPLLHAAVALANLAALVAAGIAIVHFERWYLWLPFAFVAGFAVFNCTVREASARYSCGVAPFGLRRRRSSSAA